MIEPSRFAARMAEHWSHRLTNVSSPALVETWRKIAETFNASIEDASEPLPFGADPKWRVLNPATGTGKTQGLALYASMLPTEGHPGVLVVVRLKAQADDLAATINDLTGAPRALAYHGDVKGIDPASLRNWPVLVITHAAFLRGLDLATRFKSNWSRFMALGEDGRRRLVVVDEALEVVEEAQVDLTELRRVKGMIPSVLDRFPRQKAVVELVEEVLEEQRQQGGKERLLWHRFSGMTDDLLNDADFTALLDAVRQERLDWQTVREDNPALKQRLVKRVERSLHGVRMSIESYAWYSRRASLNAANSARCVIPDDAPAAVILDATAEANAVYTLLPNLALVPVPKGARCYRNVGIHISRGHRVGKAALLDEARKGAQAFMGELERTLHHDRRVLVVCHKDMEAHIAGIPSKFTERAVAHWGALDGKNDWRDFDTVALYGLPYRPPEWAPNTLMATQGVQDTDTLQSATFKVIRKHLDYSQMATDVIQAINRVRCRKVIDGKGNCEPTDVFLWLPSGAAGDAIEAGLLAEMPGAVRLPWHLEETQSTKRRVNFGDALVAYARNLEPGSKLLARRAKDTLGVSLRSWRRLTADLQDPDSHLARTLAEAGVSYETRREGKTVKSYILKAA